jgi:hypothetical protein
MPDRADSRQLECEHCGRRGIGYEVCDCGYKMVSVIAGDRSRVPDVSEQRAGEIMRTECATCGKGGGYWGHRFDDDHPEHSYKPVPRRYVRLDDPASVLAALLAESPEATVAAIEALLTKETPLRAAAYVMYEAPPEADVARVWDVALSAACRSLLSKAPEGDGDA